MISLYSKDIFLLSKRARQQTAVRYRVLSIRSADCAEIGRGSGHAEPPPVKSGAPATRAGAYAGKFAHKKWTANAARQLAEKQPPFKGQKRELCMTGPLPWGKRSGRGFGTFHLKGKPKGTARKFVQPKPPLCKGRGTAVRRWRDCDTA